MSATTTLSTPTRLRNLLEALEALRAVPAVIFVLGWHLAIRAGCALRR